MKYGMSHYIGGFFKAFAIFAVFALSAGLSYLFFMTIAPPGKPLFAYGAMGLTEGGFVLWLAVFLLMIHEPFSKSCALLMVGACAIASFVVAGTELHILFSTADGIAGNADLYNFVQIVLEIMFGMHLLVAIVEVLHGYFSKPGNSFFSNDGNLIPTYSVEELEQMQNTITGYLTQARKGGGTARPLALPKPQQLQPNGLDVSLAQMASMVSGAANSVMKKGRDFTRRGKREAPVPGKTNETTSENSSADESESDQQSEGSEGN